MSIRDQRLRSEFDFLDESHPCAGVERSSAAFVVPEPWAIARFDHVNLRSGWWRFEATGESDVAEVRLSSSRDPLIVIQADSTARIYLGDPSGYDVALLVSAWPGAYKFSALRLVRLGQLEAGRLVVSAAARLRRRKDPLKLLLRASRQLMSGRALGLALPANSSVPYHQPEKSQGEVGFHSMRVDAGGMTLHVQEGDRLHLQAIEIAQAEFRRDSNLVAAYADVVEGGKLIPHPAWDRDLAESGAFDNAPLFLRPGAQAKDIRDAVQTWGESAVVRIPLPLVERDTQSHRLIAVELPQLERLPLVSVIIPTKFRMDLLEKCLLGLRERTGYANLEIIIVDNGVTDERFAGLVKIAGASFPVRVLEDKGPFNFSRLVNAGVRAAGGEIILLLNDDVEPLTLGWLHRMVASACSPGVGAVGARLHYPDKTIQHAGVVLGLGGTCAHLWRGTAEFNALDNPYIGSRGGRMAVTGACLAVKRADYDVVGGFDETAFPVAYNDIDFCLRLHARGLRNIYQGDAKLVHHESQSRGHDDVSITARRRQSAEAAQFLNRWRELIFADPYFSPAFDPSIETGVAHRANYRPSDQYRQIS
ncbi:MAG: glycosyltransferase family 2 protein [Alphaproteobacteria bacterium]|nr:MAG: glycosyltransferase family 2 protein [Alphaproteobacteria bacterium]